MKNHYLPYCAALLISIVLITSFLSAQAPEITWQHSIGGNKNEYLNAIKKTTDGGYIIAGLSQSGITGDKTEGNYGSDDFWIVKTDSAGNIDWQNNIGGSGTDAAIDIELTIDGGYIVGGNSFSGISGDKTEPGFGGSDCWIIKLDGAGNIEWQKVYGGSLYDNFYSIHQTDDSGYIIGAESKSNISGNKTEAAVSTNEYDYWVIKTDNLGNIEWQNTIGGTDNDYLRSLKLTEDGGYICGGSSFSEISGDKTENSVGTDDYWVVKLDASGNITWQSTIGGFGNDWLRNIYQTSEGDYLLVGDSESNMGGDKSENHFGISGSADFWIVKINATGTVLWENTIGGSSSDQVNSAFELPEGGFVITGYSMSFISGDKTENNFSAGTDDFWIVQLDDAGNLVWQKTIGGTNSDQLINSLLADDGGYILAGQSRSNISGLKTENSEGMYDYWILKLMPEILCVVPSGLYSDNITATQAKVHWDDNPLADSYQIWYRETGAGPWIKKSSAVNSKTLKSLSADTEYEYKIRSKCSEVLFGEFSPVQNFTTLPLREAINSPDISLLLYPNPANDKLNIQINSHLLSPSYFLLTITDLEGRIIYSSQLNSPTTEINISDFASGMYFVKINIDEEEMIEKFIKN